MSTHAVAAEADRQQGGHDHDQADRDHRAKLPELRCLTLDLPREADQRAKADKHAGNFGKRQE